jgi:hypothetical protein
MQAGHAAAADNVAGVDAPITAVADDPSREDARQAASIRVGISNYVGTASLAVLAGVVAVFTYYQQNYRPMVAFYVFVAGSGVAVIASLIVGGRGAASVARAVAKGTYARAGDAKAAGASEFDLQSILSLLAVVLAAVGVVCGGLSHHR